MAKCGLATPLIPSVFNAASCSLHGTIKERNVPGMLQDHWSSSAKTYAISTHRDKITKGGVGHMGRMGEAPFYQQHEHPKNCLSKCIDQCLCSFPVRWGLTPATGSSRFDYSMSES
uniref:Uncharacterized protein n=1 Tax=Opuntia streptacantha TaxID=393608 RepID=A0A7C9ALY9_OPUST